MAGSGGSAPCQPVRCVCQFQLHRPEAGSSNSASTTPHVAGSLIFFDGLLMGLLMISLPVSPSSALCDRDPADHVLIGFWPLLHDPAGESNLQRSRTRFHPTASRLLQGSPSLPSTASSAMALTGKGMDRWDDPQPAPGGPDRTWRPGSSYRRSALRLDHERPARHADAGVESRSFLIPTVGTWSTTSASWQRRLSHKQGV